MRIESGPASAPQPETKRRSALGWLGRLLFSWEDWLTFAIVLMAFLSVVGSVENADWVDSMPSLYPIAVLGLLLAFFLARLGLRDLLTHVIALVLGGAGMLWQVLDVLPEGTFKERCGEMVQRMDAWIDALTLGGINNDEFPFILFVVVLTWAAAYLSSWSIFRWRNPWLGLVPGGLVLLFNISYLPEQSSPSFILFLLGAILLVMRMHLQGRIDFWRKRHIPYPTSLHFLSLYQGLWASAVLLVAAWMIPLADSAAAFESVWRPWSQPLAERFSELGRVFAAVNVKKGPSLHGFEEFLPFRDYLGQGKGLSLVVESDQPGLLRGLVYEVYTSSGWKTADREQAPLSERAADVDAVLEEAPGLFQQPVTVKVTPDDDLPVYLTVGQPLLVDDPSAEVETGADFPDVISLLPSDSIKAGEDYVAAGLVSMAPEEELTAAGTDYPSWVTSRYLQLPDNLPENIAELAHELTDHRDNPYEKARFIEQYLRIYTHDFEAPVPPPGEDAVEYFLFKQQRGHALYHASAMVVMLRSVDIPSRLVAGFALRPDEVTEAGTYVITARDAYVWPEVYFPELGWVDFSPAPVQPLISHDVEEALPFVPVEGTPLEDLLALDDLLPGEGESAPPVPPGGSLTQAEEDRGFMPSLALMALAFIAVGVAASALGVRLAWTKGLAGLSYPAQVWEKSVRLASWAKIGPQPAQTPREYLVDLRQELPLVDDLPFLVNSYEQCEFGGKPFAERDRARLDSVWRELRGALVRRILRR